MDDHSFTRLTYSVLVKSVSLNYLLYFWQYDQNIKEYWGETF